MNQTIYPIGIQNFEKNPRGRLIPTLMHRLTDQLRKQEVTISSAARADSGRVCCYPRWRPISKGKRSCSRDWPWRSWRKSGPSIRSCIST